MSSTPSVSQFDPTIIRSQIEAIKLVRRQFPYDEGRVLELLLSGSVGSAKSLVMAHLAVTHCLLYPRARFLYGRKALPDLKDTLIEKTMEHLEGDLVDGIDFHYNKTKAEFEFSNRSTIVTRSWADKKYKKFRSLELSAAAIEELTENDSKEFEKFYPEMRARVGRLNHVPESFIVCASNPDSPAHSAYDYFINTDNPNRRVIYSLTSENPFLPKGYVDGLLQVYTKQEAERMIYGRWVEISKDVIYYAYCDTKNVIRSYSPDPLHPVILSFDFNIGDGKPMSMLAMQYIDDVFYVFDECIVHGARTEDILEEAYGRGLITHQYQYVIHGDATGRRRSTNYNKSDYDVIQKFMANCHGDYNKRITFTEDVPKVNPHVRERHIMVNGQLQSADNKRKILISENCTILRKGMRLTALKKGGAYVEDDNNEYQHCTTALGYAVCRQLKTKLRGRRFLQTKV